MDSDTIIGIDLGTTNSEVAILSGGKPEVVREDGDAILPSCVGLDEAGNVIVGGRARNQAAVAPERTVLSIKRLMGSGERVPMGTEEYTPQEISAFILKALRERAARALGHDVHKAVITVPAYFTDAQRQATREAGRSRRAGGRADHQRADRRRAELRGPRRGKPQDSRLRSGRRDLRRLRGGDRRRRGRGAGVDRGQSYGRRRLRPGRRRTPQRSCRDRAGYRRRPREPPPAGTAEASVPSRRRSSFRASLTSASRRTMSLQRTASRGISPAS